MSRLATLALTAVILAVAAAPAAAAARAPIVRDTQIQGALLQAGLAHREGLA